MATRKRSTTFAQESIHPITRVALYARVSTLNNQDRNATHRTAGICRAPRLANHSGIHRSGSVRLQGVTSGSESTYVRRLSPTVRCDPGLENRPLWESLKHLVNSLAELAALGVAFISLRDNLDLSTPSGRLMFQIIGAMAEFERALIQERVRAGLRNARAKEGGSAGLGLL